MLIAHRTDAQQWTEFERREFLRIRAVAAASIAFAPPGRARPIEPDVGLLDRLEDLTAQYRARDRSTGSAHVTLWTASHVERLVRMVRRAPAEHPLRPRLLSVTADAAILAGWLCYDQLESVGAERWFTLGARLAGAAGDFDLQAGALANLAQVLAENGRVLQARTILANALWVPANAPMRAFVVLHEASVHIAERNRYQTLAALDRAETILEDADTSELPRFASFMNKGYVRSWRGRSYITLDMPDLAVPELRMALPTVLPPFYRYRGSVLLNLARANIRAGNLSEGCNYLADAFPILERVGSTRYLHIARGLLATLEPERVIRALTELTELTHRWPDHRAHA